MAAMLHRMMLSTLAVAFAAAGAAAVLGGAQAQEVDKIAVLVPE